jgi:hypothetical protein
MAYRKKTLRTMSPTARKLARLEGELKSVAKRLHNLIEDVKRLEFESKALLNIQATYKAKFGDFDSKVTTGETPAQVEGETLDFDSEDSG